MNKIERVVPNIHTNQTKEYQKLQEKNKNTQKKTLNENYYTKDTKKIVNYRHVVLNQRIKGKKVPT